jgi:class 3 adenylate cyclase
MEYLMKQWENIKDGSIRNFLMCTVDITGFGAFMKNRPAADTLSLMKDVAALVTGHVASCGGLVVKYLGDEALVIFPEESVDTGVRCIMELEKALLDYFGKKDLANRISTAMHFGEAAMGKLPPFDTWDIYGRDVNLLFLLENRNAKGRTLITPQVFRKLPPETRKLFHKFTPPVVYFRE